MKFFLRLPDHKNQPVLAPSDAAKNGFRDHIDRDAANQSAGVKAQIM